LLTNTSVCILDPLRKRERHKRSEAYRNHGFLWAFGGFAGHGTRGRAAAGGTASGAFIDPRIAQRRYRHNLRGALRYVRYDGRFFRLPCVEQVQHLPEHGEKRSSNVEELYWLAEQLPEPERAEIQELVVSYARAVVDEECGL
jgi:hypothetical protein